MPGGAGRPRGASPRMAFNSSRFSNVITTVFRIPRRLLTGSRKAHRSRHRSKLPSRAARRRRPRFSASEEQQACGKFQIFHHGTRKHYDKLIRHRTHDVTIAGDIPEQAVHGGNVRGAGAIVPDRSSPTFETEDPSNAGMRRLVDGRTLRHYIATVVVRADNDGRGAVLFEFEIRWQFQHFANISYQRDIAAPGAANVFCAQWRAPRRGQRD